MITTVCLVDVRQVMISLEVEYLPQFAYEASDFHV